MPALLDTLRDFREHFRVLSQTSHDSKNGFRLSDRMGERLNAIKQSDQQLGVICADGQIWRLQKNASEAIQGFGVVTGCG